MPTLTRGSGRTLAPNVVLVAVLALGCAADRSRATVDLTPPPTPLGAPALPPSAPHYLDAGFQRGGWATRADAPWWAVVDLRNILAAVHPLVVSTAGAEAGATRELVVPPEWKAPFALRFGCGDDYSAARGEAPGVVGVENFVGHRFKQVVVDDRVVWERDVADDASHAAPAQFTVDLTPYVRPGQRFRLTLRVLDRTSTLERNAEDQRFIRGIWYAPGDGQTELPPRFHTAVWFSDPVFGEAAAVAAAPPGHRPHEAAAAERHRSRGPIVPRGAPPATEASLALVAPVRVPAPGFPLELGLPLPRGSLRDAAAARVLGPDGRDLSRQGRPLAFWPDGSIRWLGLQTLLPGGAQPSARFTLKLDGEAPPASDAPLVVTRVGQGLRVDNGVLTLEAATCQGLCPANALIDTVRLRRAPAAPRSPARPGRPPLPPASELLLRDLGLWMAVRSGGQPAPVVTAITEVVVVDQGPVAVTFEVRGALEAPGLHVGRFTLRVTMFAGLATLKASLRIIDDVKPSPYLATVADPPLDVLRLALVASTPGAGQARAGVGGAALLASPKGMEVIQQSAEQVAVTGETAPRKGKLDGWIATDTVEVAGWRLAEQYPKALRADGSKLKVELFVPTAETPLYHPRFGEAKRHDLWIRFLPDHADDAAFGALANEPPRLFDAAWFATSGAAGVHDPAWFQHQPELARWAEHTYGDVQAGSWPGSLGLRDFGDKPYKPPQWMNGYWAMIQGGVAWGLAGATPRWLDRAHEVARHVADVDTVHLEPGHPDFATWDGVTCALGHDHSVHGGDERWGSYQAGDQLLLDGWLTGDRDSLADGLANANYLIRSGNGIGSPGVRDQTRGILVLLAAWKTTRDGRYLDAARRYLDLDAMSAKVLDFRRGAYVSPIYKNWWVVSAGLDSMYALSVDEYYRSTGDERAAQLVVAVADSVYSESMLPQEDALGSFLFYPRYERGATYYSQMALLFHIAYDLTLDRRFLRAGRAAFARYLLARTPDGRPNYQPVGNFGWLDPVLGGWMQELRDVPTDPFTITRETPDPDPSSFAPSEPGG